MKNHQRGSYLLGWCGERSHNSGLYLVAEFPDAIVCSSECHVQDSYHNGIVVAGIH